MRNKPPWTETGWQNKVARVERDSQSKQNLNDQHKEFEPTAIKFRQRSRDFSAFFLTGVVLFVIASFSGSSNLGGLLAFTCCAFYQVWSRWFSFSQNCAAPTVLQMLHADLLFCPECNGSHLSKYKNFSAKNAMIAESYLETARVETIGSIIPKMVAWI